MRALFKLLNLKVLLTAFLLLFYPLVYADVKPEPQSISSSETSFFEENKKHPGVVTLPDGLQYKVLKEGTGEHPSVVDFVTANYKGSLIDGKEFEATAPGNPVTFPVNTVIPGLEEALQLMKPGAHWVIYIPSKLAYGEKGAGKIGPNTPLIFDVELLSVMPTLDENANGTLQQEVMTD